MAESNKLAIILHHNDEVTVRDERGYPLLCRDCRYSGWLTQYERQQNKTPHTCLLYSGGADIADGDRVVFDDIRKGWDDYGLGKRKHDDQARQSRNRYPKCLSKNPDGNCKDFVKAKPLPWLGNFWRKLFKREWRSRKMRL